MPDDTAACDAKAYCEECATSATCTTLLAAAHDGRMKDVTADTQDDISDEYWHAGQAYDMIVSLHYVCRFARKEGIIAPPNTTKGGEAVAARSHEGCDVLWASLAHGAMRVRSR